ncbi:MAG: hypothetical protein HFG63_02385 [Lachnospiraceae bacterium]|nr:hypothetical protein [Lachnospiraceae bacterium]
MKELLQQIGSTEAKNIEELDGLCDVVRTYYTNNRRHRYSDVSGYLMETDDVEYLLENLRKIQNRLAEFPQDERNSVKVFKLIDHITLELNRTRYNSRYFMDMQAGTMNMVMNRALKEIGQATDALRREQAEKIAVEVGKYRKKTKNLKRRVEDAYSQFVAILGIFSAVVLVFFGGMTAFSALFANLHQIGRFKLVFITSLVGMIIFDLVFMFLYILAKLLDRRIGSVPMSGMPTADTLLDRLRRVWLLYPYVVVFNGWMVFLMTASFIGWYGANYLGWRI